MAVHQFNVRVAVYLGLRIRGSSTFPRPISSFPPLEPSWGAVAAWRSHSCREGVGHTTDTPRPGTPLTPFHRCLEIEEMFHIHPFPQATEH
jgi:hypothetical protein